MNSLPSNLPPGPPPNAPNNTPAQPAARTFHAGVSNIRFAVAMAVAVLADTVGLPFGEFGVVVFDVLVGVLLALCLGGFRPELIIAFLLEAIPGVGIIPSWSVAVPALWARTRFGRSAAAATPASNESTRPN